MFFGSSCNLFRINSRSAGKLISSSKHCEVGTMFSDCSLQCNAECGSPPPNNVWVSNIMASGRATSARLEWEAVMTSGDARYVVVWRNAESMDAFRMTQDVRRRVVSASFVSE